MSKDNIEKLATGLVPPAFIADLLAVGAPVEIAGKAWHDLRAIDEKRHSTLQAINADGNLSTIGQDAATATAAKSLFSEAQKIRLDFERTVEQLVSKARHDLKPKQIDESVQHHRQAEIRRIVSEIVGDDDLAMQEVLRNAVAASDSEVLDSILDAPSVWPQSRMVGDRESLLASRMKMADADLGPETAALIDASREMAPKFETIEGELSAIAFPTDTVADLASGKEADDD